MANDGRKTSKTGTAYCPVGVADSTGAKNGDSWWGRDQSVSNWETIMLRNFNVLNGTIMIYKHARVSETSDVVVSDEIAETAKHIIFPPTAPMKTIFKIQKMPVGSLVLVQGTIIEVSITRDI